jgi:hypothetical protein
MQFWDISDANNTKPEGGRIALQSNEMLCLDAGDQVTNGTWVTLEACNGDATGQRWNYIKAALGFLSLSTQIQFQDREYHILVH